MNMEWFERMRQATLALLRDERGAEGVEKLLIIGAIVFPLLLILIVLKDYVIEWANEGWNDVRDAGDNQPGFGD